MEGCPIIETDISNALHNKDANFTWRDIAILRELSESHEKGAPIQMDESKETQICQDEYDLVMKKIDYDMQVFRVRGHPNQQK